MNSGYSLATKVKRANGGGVRKDGAINPIELHGAIEVVDVLARRGMIAVLNALILGPLGHNELARETNMDSKQLSRTLVLARDTGIVDRIVSGEIPPVRVHYELTPRGEDLARAIIPLALWSKNS